MQCNRIGIVMLSAVGDVVHTLPVVTALKRQWPTAMLSWVLQPGPATLVRGHPAVDEIITFERQRGMRAFLDARRELSRREFDVVLDLQSYFKAGLITSFSRSPIKLGYDRARARDLNWMFTNRHLAPRPRQHIQEEYLEFLDALGVPRDPLTWQLGPWPKERGWQDEFFARFDRPVAALVIGSSKPQKGWPAERWARLAEILYSDYHLQPVLVGARSSDEEATERRVTQLVPGRAASALGSGLRRLVAILDRSALVVSIDTGPLHMAVALERPVISLMGYTNPKRVGPWRRFHDLLIDAYGDPGEQYPISMETRRDRMHRIRVEDVQTKLEIWRERYAPVVGVAPLG
ncbi:MAG: glycosyltransferase family 9 protein [Gemmatimonadota bacterium]|nr:glycosyltransferase family 9 protein [Gemmatimonadota bacterium]